MLYCCLKHEWWELKRVFSRQPKWSGRHLYSKEIFQTLGFVGNSQHFELGSENSWQPIPPPQNRRDMLVPCCTCQNTSSSSLHQLQLPSHLQRQPHVELVTIIELGCDQGTSNCDKVLLIEEGKQLVQQPKLEVCTPCRHHYLI